MKQILFMVGFLCATLISSCQCETSNTVAMHYTIGPRGHGIGTEIGWTGQESPISFHFGVDVFKQFSSFEEKHPDSSQMYGRLYNKLGLRVFRIPYKLSIYADVQGGLDINTGFYWGVGTKFLVPLNTKAISLEPMYVNKEFNLQLAIHFII